MSRTHTGWEPASPRTEIATPAPSRIPEAAPAAERAWPLSFAQQRLWFLEQLEPGTAIYNIPMLARLTGPLDITALQHALNGVVRRHEALRTRFICQNDQPLQVVDDELSLQIKTRDLTNAPAEDADKIIRDEVNLPFEFGSGPLLRLTLLRLKPEEHLLLLTMHHIVADEWSLNVFFKELGLLYQAAVEGQEPSLAPLPIQYREFAVSQREIYQGQALEDQLAFWKEQLRGKPAVTELLPDFPRPSAPSSSGRSISRPLPDELGTALKQFAKREGSSLFMLLFAAFDALVYRYTGQEDLIVASPSAGRSRIETEELIGFFVNTLPLRTRLEGNPSFRELLKRVRRMTLDAYAHADAPFERLVQELQPERSLTHLPFTRLMFVLFNGMLERLHWGSLDVEFLPVETDTAKCDLVFGVQESSRGLIARAEFNTALFDAGTMERLLEHFENLLTSALETPDRPIAELDLLSQAERRQLLVEWNRTATVYPRDKSLQQLFEAQVQRWPDAVAARFGSQVFTYAELNQRANQLAASLRQFNPQPDQPIAVCLPRSLELLVSILAIIKSGAAYAPLDPEYPEERLRFMLSDTQSSVLITTTAIQQQLEQVSANGHSPSKFLCLDAEAKTLAQRPTENPPPSAKPDNLGYVLYTSGSTGQPKGVAVPQRAVARLVLNTNYIQLTSQDRMAHVSNVSFDAATLEIWGALLNGAQLVGIPNETILSPSDFARELKQQKISAIFLTSALFSQLAHQEPRAFESIRTVMAGGDALDAETVRRVLRHHPPERLVNGYGPTENTTFTCCHWIKELPEDATNVPIGRPISNTQVYILDRNLNPVPLGVPGELYAGGDGLARGYWNRPELTAEKFVPNPFRESGGSEYLYRTGDRARYLPNGDVEFLGRLDEQVKIRGFRIEPGEIEAALRRHPAIAECVVRAWPQTGRNALIAPPAPARRDVLTAPPSQEKLLAAYVVFSAEPKLSATELRRFLQRSLPEHMLPAAFVTLKALPLTPNGKVDRDKLPRPETGRADLEKAFVAPRDDVELKLAKVWENVLDVRPVGIHDRFFDLGGHSLLAIRLVAHIEKVFGRKLRVATVFQAQTIEELAAILREETKESIVTSSTSVVQIQSEGSRPPLFLVHGAGGGMFWGYMNLARRLGNNQPVYAFRSRGLDGREEFEHIEEMAGQYVNDLRAIQPHGPYHLGGYCFGGVVAFEMARQLSAQGEDIGLLALLNCSPPNSSYTEVRVSPAWCGRFLKNVLYWGGYMKDWSPRQRREFFRWKCDRFKKRFADSSQKAALDIGDLVDLSSFSPDERELWEAHIRALLLYQPRPFVGKVHLFRSPGHPIWCSFSEDYGWTDLARDGVKVQVVPGAHEKILEEPCVGDVAKALQKVLGDSDPAAAPDGDCVPPRGTSPSVSVTPGAPPQPTAEWFKELLSGAPALLELPTDKPRPATQGCATASASRVLSPGLQHQLQLLSDRLEVNESTMFLAALNVLLARYSRQQDIIIGELSGNLLPLRWQVDETQDLRALLMETERVRHAALAHSELPFEKLLAELNPPRDQSFHPICQVAFSTRRPGPANSPLMSGHVPPEPTAFDLHFQIFSAPQNLRLEIVYATDLFEQETIDRMLGHWQTLVEGLLEDLSRPISQVSMLTTAEHQQLLHDWTATEKEYPKHKNLIDLFEEQAARTPQAEALVAKATRLSYAALEQGASAVAEHLQALGVGKESLVAICVERSWEMVAGILGTLKAGGAYVPMDPAYPKDRLAFMLEDAQAQVLFTQRKLLGSLPPTKAKILCIEDVAWEASGNSQPSASTANNGGTRNGASSRLAYVIYTSGSTGKPKGVLLENRNAVAMVCWARDVFTAEELSGVLASTSICFDLSVFEIFVPLCTGGKVILADNALGLPRLPAATEVRMINTVPSAIRELLRVNGVPKSVQVVNLAGEPLPTPLVEQIYSGTSAKKVYDLYGPTETTTYSTFTLRKPGEPATIGKPLANEQVYLLDAYQNPVPVGVPGEIYIGGDGVTRGYLNRPELTAEKFISNLFRPGGRLYKTGDLGKWRPDGNIQFLGRIDYQVKIRGFRIELGEIESALKKHAGIREAVVLAREDQPGDKRLAAYIVSNGKAPAIDELRQSLREHLPEFMVPSAFVFLEALPLTPNGKVDRKALPVPEQDRNAAATEFAAARTPTEENICAIWRDLLGLKQVGIRDNFFDLGGNSLLAIRVISRIRETTKLELPLSVLFDTPTIEMLAAGLEANRWGEQTETEVTLTKVSRSAPLPVSFVQERLWFLDQLLPGSHAYHVPAALRLHGPLDTDALTDALNAIAVRHEVLRTSFTYADGELAQVIQPQINLELPVTDVSTSPVDKKETQARQAVNALAHAAFDLSRGPLIRAGLVRLDTDEHVLAVVMHHSISDGWSLSVFFRELESLYRAQTSGQSAPLADLPFQYADYAAWKRQSMQGPALQKELAFWKERLAGAPPELELPTDHSEPAQPTRHCARLNLEIPQRMRQAITELGQRESASPFIVVTAALAITLHKWTGQRDLVVGTVVAGRNRRELEQLLGCFMNFLPLRLRVRSGHIGTQVLAEARKAILEAQNHQECPFEKMVEAINPERKLNQNPLYNVALLFQNFPGASFSSDGVSCEAFPVDMEAALLDLRFEAEEKGETLSIACEYRTELFEAATIEQVMAAFRQTLELLTEKPQTALAQFPVPAAGKSEKAVASAPKQRIAITGTFTTEPLNDPLRYWLKELGVRASVEFAPYNQVFQQLLDSWSLLARNDTGLNVILLRIEDWQRVQAHEEHTSTNRNGNGHTDHSRTVERSAKEFVAALKAATARTSTPHLVCICPASTQVTSDPAKSGALSRVEKSLVAELEKVTGVYLLTTQDLNLWYPVKDFYDASSDELGHVPYTPVFFTALATGIARKFHALKRAPYKVIALDCDNTLWSGVCGEDGAKGIRLEPAFLALHKFMRAQLDAGMLLCVCSKNNEQDVYEVFEQRLEMPLRREHFASWRLNWKPKSENLKSLARELNVGLDSFIFLDDNPVECAEVDANCPEVLALQLPENPEAIPQFLEHCWAFDHLRVTTEDRKRAEMYRQNQQREQLRSQSVSLNDFLASLELKSEIAPISAEQLPRCAQLTQRTNQFNVTTRRRTEAELQALGTHMDIIGVTVSDRFGDYGLTGLMMASEEHGALEIDTFLLSCRVLGRGVEHRMLARLGEIARERKLNWVNVHFVPSPKNRPALDFLESIGSPFRQPLNGGYLFRFPAGFAAEVTFNPQSEPAPKSNGSKAESASESTANHSSEYRLGKFTRCRQIAFEADDAVKIHERMEARSAVRSVKRAGYTPPRTALERQLCELWQKLLHIERIGVYDNFFELGGHSLLAVRLFAEIEKITGRKLPLVTLFQSPTIRQLGAVLDSSHTTEGRSLLVPLQPNGSKPPLFLVHGAGGDVLWGYANLAAHMPADQPIYGIRSCGQAGREEYSRIEEMAGCYVQEIKTLQPEGPYLLGGYCFGGNVACEMARQLNARGEQVALVFLFDSAPSNAGYEHIPWWSPAFWLRFGKNLSYWVEDFSQLDSKDQVNFVGRKVRALGRGTLRRLGLKTDSAGFDLEAVIDPGHFPENELRLWRVHLHALVTFVDKEYEGNVLLLRTRGQPLFCSLQEDFCWGNLAKGGVTVRHVPGSHESVFMEPNVQALAGELNAALERISCSIPSQKYDMP